MGFLGRRNNAQAANMVPTTVAMPASPAIHCNVLQSLMWTEALKRKTDTLGAACGTGGQVLGQEPYMVIPRAFGRLETVRFVPVIIHSDCSAVRIAPST